MLRNPDPQDAEVARQQRMANLHFVRAVQDALPEVVRLLMEAESTDEALEGVARLLGVEEAAVLVGLARFDLLALTRPATAQRHRLLDG